MIYLCVIVRRIRRDLGNLSKSGSLVYTDANENRQIKKDDKSTNRLSSSAGRYTIEPGKAKPANRRSAVRTDPEETVTYLTRPGEMEPSAPNPASLSTFQGVGSSQEQIALHQYVNRSFEPDSSHDQRDSTSDSSSEIICDPPIYSNEGLEDEQPVYENNLTEDPVYQNRGELAVRNNPERPRLQTMDITDIA